jgi:hypothetical protein
MLTGAAAAAAAALRFSSAPDGLFSQANLATFAPTVQFAGEVCAHWLADIWLLSDQPQKIALLTSLAAAGKMRVSNFVKTLGSVLASQPEQLWFVMVIIWSQFENHPILSTFSFCAASKVHEALTSGRFPLRDRHHAALVNAIGKVSKPSVALRYNTDASF